MHKSIQQYVIFGNMKNTNSRMQLLLCLHPQNCQWSTNIHTQSSQTCDSEHCLNTLPTDAVVDHAQVLATVLHHRLLDDQRPSHLSYHHHCLVPKFFSKVSLTCFTLSSSFTNFLLLFDFMNLYHLQHQPMSDKANWSHKNMSLFHICPNNCITLVLSKKQIYSSCVHT